MTMITYIGPGEHGQHAFSSQDGIRFDAYIGDGITPPQPGAQVDAVWEQKTSKQGKAYTKVIQINGQKASYQGTGGGFSKGGGGRSAPHYDPRTFVSNVVGQAIAAGVIKEPAQVAEWAQVAYKTIQAVAPSAARSEIGQSAGSATPPAAAPASSPASIPPGGDDIPF